MSGIVFACIAPPAWLAHPLISGEPGMKATVTRQAMEELGRRMEATKPDTIIVATPHGTEVEGLFSLLDTSFVRGETGHIAFVGGKDHSFTLEFDVDRTLNEHIVEEARKQNVPAARIRHDSSWIPLTLDFGSTTPLWFMGAMFVPGPRVVITCAGPGIAREMYPRFGQAMRLAAEASGRRVAFIASADLSHAHDANSEFGYDPAAAEFDQMIMEAVRNKGLERLMTLDREWLGRVKTDAFGQLLMLHGMIAETDFQGELLSYEAPTYFGMLCAAYERPSGG